MSYDNLAKIENLVHDLWDAAALFCLEYKALRYTQLHRDMTAWSGRHLSESELTRTRHRLVRRRMIGVRPSDNGHNVYHITDAGRAHLRKLRILIQIAPHLDRPKGDEPNDTPQPSRPSSNDFSKRPSPTALTSLPSSNAPPLVGEQQSFTPAGPSQAAPHHPPKPGA